MMLVAGKPLATVPPRGVYRRPLRVQTISAVSRPITDRNFTSRRIISWILLSSFVMEGPDSTPGFPV
jgi:hypothetical protein